METKFNNFRLNENKIENIRDKKKIFSSDSGFDTPKKINRSEKIVDKEILDDIENGITLETLNEIDLPIFKYTTQITIHGLFDKLTQQRIGGYKWIFQNKNKSIGIKWNAIDYEKKLLIYRILRRLGYSITKNSNEFSASMVKSYNEENYNELKKLYNNIDDDLFIGGKDLYIGEIPYVGKFVVLKIYINAIPKDNVWKLLNNSFDITESKWDELEEEHKKKEEERKKKEDKELEERMAEHDRRKKEELKQKREEYKEKYEVITSFDQIPDEDCVMIYLNKYSEEILIKKYTKNGKTKYQVMKYNSYDRKRSKDEINTRLSKYDASEERVKKHFDNGFDAFLYKTFETEKPKEEKPKKERTIKNFDDFKSNDISIVDYSDRAVAVFGNTYPIKDKLKNLNGRFNKFLTNPKTGKKEAGWIFPKTRKDELEKIINK